MAFPNNEEERLFSEVFQKAGFKVVRAVRDCMYIISPVDEAERAEYGSWVASQRAISSLSKILWDLPKNRK